MKAVLLVQYVRAIAPVHAAGGRDQSREGAHDEEEAEEVADLPGAESRARHLDVDAVLCLDSHQQIPAAGVAVAEVGLRVGGRQGEERLAHRGGGAIVEPPPLPALPVEGAPAPLEERPLPAVLSVPV